MKEETLQCQQPPQSLRMHRIPAANGIPGFHLRQNKKPQRKTVWGGGGQPHIAPHFGDLGGGVVVQTELIVSWDKAPKLPTWVDFEGRGNASLQYLAICLHGQLGADPKPPDLHTRPHNHPPQTSTQGPITAPKRAP